MTVSSVFSTHTEFEDLLWLPDPVLSEGTGYKPFKEIYGTETKDSERPSLKDSCRLSETDKTYHGFLNAGTFFPEFMKIQLITRDYEKWEYIYIMN